MNFGENFIRVIPTTNYKLNKSALLREYKIEYRVYDYNNFFVIDRYHVVKYFSIWLNANLDMTEVKDYTLDDFDFINKKLFLIDYEFGVNDASR